MNTKYIGIIKTQKFKRLALKKHWKIETESIELLTLEHAQNFANSSEFFKKAFNGKETIERGHTTHGFLPCVMTSISPDALTKMVRTFEYTTE